MMRTFFVSTRVEKIFNTNFDISSQYLYLSISLRMQLDILISISFSLTSLSFCLSIFVSFFLSVFHCLYFSVVCCYSPCSFLSSVCLFPFFSLISCVSITLLIFTYLCRPSPDSFSCIFLFSFYNKISSNLAWPGGRLVRRGHLHRHQHNGPFSLS